MNASKTVAKIRQSFGSVIERFLVQVDPNYANAYLNLGVLCELYLQQPERALQAYERYLELSPSPDARVNAWVSELKKRIGAEPRAARSE